VIQQPMTDASPGWPLAWTGLSGGSYPSHALMMPKAESGNHEWKTAKIVAIG
jgi:hypothetical protein